VISKVSINPFVQLALALSAGSALIYEVVVTESLFFFFIESSYSIATALSVFLFGLAVGSYLIHLFLKKIKDRRLFFGLLQIISGLYAFFILSHLTSIIPEIMQLGVFVASFAILLIPTIILGAVFPLAGSIFKRDGEKIGLLYSSDLAGAILGALLAGFFLIPYFGLSITVMVGAALNITSAIIILPKKIKLFSFIVVAVFFIVLFVPSESKFFGNQLEEGYHFQENSQYGTVSVREVEYTYQNEVLRTKESKILGLYIDERIQCVYNYHPNTTEVKIVDYTIDPLGIENPRVLNIGLGCGTTLLNVLNKTDIQVNLVEINPVVLKANKKFSNVLSDSRVNVILDDGLDHLRKGGNYDSIILDIEHPSIVHSSNLYTVEAFELVNDSIAEGGAFGLWSYSGNDRYLDIIYYTLKEEFSFITYFDQIFVASNTPLGYDQYVPTSPREINTIDRKILYDAANYN